METVEGESPPRLAWARTLRGRDLVLLAGVALALGACSSGSRASLPASSGSAATVLASPGQGERIASGWTVSTADKAGIGTYLVADALAGADPLTLYSYLEDTIGSGTSACEGTCATTWPAFVISATERVQAKSDVRGTFATITRMDGSAQVTYNGAPLYFYVGDHNRDDTKGQGIDRLWNAAAP